MVELAFAMPVFLGLLTLALATVAALAAKVWCADLAGMTARAAARGEAVSAVTERLDPHRRPGTGQSTGASAGQSTGPNGGPSGGPSGGPTAGSTAIPDGSTNGRSDGREIVVTRDGDVVRVTVRMRVHTPLLGGLVVEEHAAAEIEPTAEASSP